MFAMMEYEIVMFLLRVTGGRHGDDRHGTELHLIPDPKFRRLKCVIDIPLAIKLFYSSQ